MKMSVRVGLFVSFCLAFTQISRAVTFSVSPNVISNDYNGVITFTVSGLAAGESVQVVQHRDFNANGAIDTQDFAVRGDLITDGNARLLGTNANINLIRDEDGAANGAISATCHFQLSPWASMGIGKYVLECRSPSNHFATVTAPFTVASAAYPQSVQGSVTCSGTNVPFAAVEVIEMEDNGDPRFVVGGNADASGHYSIPTPAGAFAIVGVQSGLIGNLKSFPQVTIAAGVTVTTNIVLTGATRTLSGSVVDALNPSLHPIPFASLILTATNQDATMAICDANGNFSVPVTANAWEIALMPQSAISQGYMVHDDYGAVPYDTTAGDVTTAQAVTRSGTALLYGRITDSTGQPVAGVEIYADADFQYNGFAFSDTNGDYTMAIDAGFGSATPVYPNDPPANGYLWPSPQFNINDGTAYRLDITGHAATVHLHSRVTDNFGAPIPFVHGVVSSYTDYGTYSYVAADSNGELDIPCYGGEWDFQIIDPVPGVLFPDNRTLTFVDGNDYTNDVVGMRTTGNIHGFIIDSQSNPVTGIPVMVTNSVGTTNFTAEFYTDQFGFYTVDVFDGTWNVWPYLESSSAYLPVGTTNVVVPPETNEVDFVAQIAPPPTILTTSLFDATVNSFYDTILEATNGAQPLSWSITAGALPDGLTLEYYGFIDGTPTTAGTFNFTVQVVDGRGSNDVKALSIKVNPQPTGPLSIVSTYFSDAAVACSYSNILQATGGLAPYTWTLDPNSGPMPDGLTFDSNGVISGTPSLNNSYNILVRCTDAGGTSVTGYVGFAIQNALQISYPILTPGMVGTSYFGGLYANGGAQPQTWSIIAGSLPPGLTMDPASGYITGTNTALGVFNFTIRVADHCTTIDTATSITNYPMLQITSLQLPNGRPNESYSGQLQATGGVPPYTWYPNIVPFGLTVNTDGTVTGTAYNEGTNTLDVYVYDSGGFYAETNVTLLVTSQAQPPTLDLPTHNTTGFTFRVSGTTGQDYTLQSTVDLTNWNDVFTTNAPTDVFTISDTNQINGQRYYRLRAGQ